MAGVYVTGYVVTNIKTGAIRVYKTRAAASKAADRIDNAFGAYICRVKAHWSDEPI